MKMVFSDEMNGHPAQSNEAKWEIQQLMMVAENAITPQNNRPVYSVVLDTMLTTCLITRRNVLFTKEDVFQMLYQACGDEASEVFSRFPPAILYPKKMWTGKQVFSMILPVVYSEDGRFPHTSIHLTAYSKIHDESDESNEKDSLFLLSDGIVRIHSNELLMGIIDKNTIGTSEGSIIQLISKQFGNVEICSYLNRLQQITNWYAQQYSYTIGISSFLLSKDTKQKIDEVKRKGREDFANAPPSEKNGINERVRDECGRSLLASCRRSTNSVIQMVASGSKGSDVNIAQTSACVGPQNIDNVELRTAYNGRPLPTYDPDECGNNGDAWIGVDYVDHSFLQGLTPSEFFYHSQAGRIGVIDTAIKTAETGYLTRRIMKLTEDITIEYDGTVRNALGKIIQFSYGGNSMDPCCLLSSRMKLHGMNECEIKQKYHFSFDLWNNDIAEYIRLDVLRDLPNHKDIIHQHWEDLEYYAKFLNLFGEDTQKILLPFDLNSLISDSHARYPNCLLERITNDGIVKYNASDLYVSYILDEFVKLRKFFETESWNDDYVSKHNATMIRIHIESELSPKLAWTRHKLNKERFDFLIRKIQSAYVEGLSDPGESIGAIAAQSIGEPCTQMTLNTVCSFFNFL